LRTIIKNIEHYIFQGVHFLHASAIIAFAVCAFFAQRIVLDKKRRPSCWGARRPSGRGGLGGLENHLFAFL
jgi:hypothetical protein